MQRDTSKEHKEQTRSLQYKEEHEYSKEHMEQVDCVMGYVT